MLQSCCKVEELIDINERIISLEITDFSTYLDTVLKLFISTLIWTILGLGILYLFFGWNGATNIGFSIGLFYNWYWLVQNRDFGFFIVLLIFIGFLGTTVIVQRFLNWLYLKKISRVMNGFSSPAKKQPEHQEQKKSDIITNYLQTNRERYKNEINSLENPNKRSLFTNFKISDPSLLEEFSKLKESRELEFREFSVFNDKNTQISVTEPKKIPNEVIIGDQVWMRQNLSKTTFRNGDYILHAKSAGEWQKAGQNGEAAYCYYNYEILYMMTKWSRYGLLYNWYAINDRRGLAPEGWKIPSDDEWTQLVKSVGGKSEAASRLKSSRYWDEKESKLGSGQNSVGFEAYPSGYCGIDGACLMKGDSSIFWSSSEVQNLLLPDEKGAWCWEMNNFNPSVLRKHSSKEHGFAVRCIKKIE
jgi:uncharacterized protein (TIGR02145 family)